MNCETADFRSPAVPPELYDIPRVINILILGEANVGKSTWINSFANYISFKSLEDAENGKPCTLIPSEFSIYDTNINKITVRTHSVRNEAPNANMLTTQVANVHSFDVGKTTIRLIDTPGVGSPQGVWQDKTNFEFTLTTIANLEELHGICILLKSNNVRFSMMFRLYIKEILTLLHHDAVKNILFCFTNSRETLFRPGGALSTLENLLTENQSLLIPISPDTVYCLDNEAYRYLAAIKNQPPIKIPDDERKIFVTSWNKSTKETKRMLTYIKNLTPHKIQNTLALNYVRNLVLKLSSRFEEMKRRIQLNQSMLENDKKEIERLTKNFEDLKRKLIENKMIPDTTVLTSPNTVCGNSNCYSILDLGGNKTTIAYTQVCHARCHCTLSVPSDTPGHPELINCCVFNRDTCRKCGHGYRDHLHLYSETNFVSRPVENPVVRKLLDEYAAPKEMKQNVADQNYAKLEEERYEVQVVEKVLVRVVYFLKNNAIALHNETTKEYINGLIREQEEKVKEGESRYVLDSITQSWDSYNFQKYLLQKYQNEHIENIPGTADIVKLVNGLQELKHSGQLMANLLWEHPEQTDEQME